MHTDPEQDLQPLDDFIERPQPEFERDYSLVDETRILPVADLLKAHDQLTVAVDELARAASDNNAEVGGREFFVCWDDRKEIPVVYRLDEKMPEFINKIKVREVL